MYSIFLRVGASADVLILVAMFAEASMWSEEGGEANLCGADCPSLLTSPGPPAQPKSPGRRDNARAVQLYSILC